MSKNPLDYQPGGNHYKKHQDNAGVQPIELIHNMDFCTASAIKYILRKKPGQDMLDLEKIVHYCEFRKYYDENQTQVSAEDFYELNKDSLSPERRAILFALLSYDMDKAMKLSKQLLDDKKRLEARSV